MQAVTITNFGVDQVRVAELPDPVVAAGEVLIRNEASTINPADVGVVTGSMAANFPAGARSPYTPGWDLAGRVEAAGDGVDPGLVGARVVGFSPWMFTGQGTQASLVALPLPNVAVVPEGVRSAQFTTVGLNGLTAWRAVEEVAPAPWVSQGGDRRADRPVDRARRQ